MPLRLSIIHRVRSARRSYLFQIGMGLEPVLVGGGELVVVVLAFFEFGEEGGMDLEGCGRLGEGDVGVLA